MTRQTFSAAQAVLGLSVRGGRRVVRTVGDAGRCAGCLGRTRAKAGNELRIWLDCPAIRNVPRPPAMLISRSGSGRHDRRPHINDLTGR
jgi:hypothetical protein